MVEEVKTEEGIHCDVCSVDMRNYPGRSFTAGLNIQLPPDSKEGRRVQEIFGKTAFKVCCVCMLKSAGILPLLVLRGKDEDVFVPEPEEPTSVVQAGEIAIPQPARRGRPPKEKKEETVTV